MAMAYQIEVPCGVGWTRSHTLRAKGGISGADTGNAGAVRPTGSYVPSLALVKHCPLVGPPVGQPTNMHLL